MTRTYGDDRCASPIEAIASRLKAHDYWMTTGTTHLRLTCKFAVWERTYAGKRHPSGDGTCKWSMPHVPIAASRYWIGGQPKPSGGHINRRMLPMTTKCETYVQEPA